MTNVIEGINYLNTLDDENNRKVPGKWGRIIKYISIGIFIILVGVTIILMIEA